MSSSSSVNERLTAYERAFSKDVRSSRSSLKERMATFESGAGRSSSGSEANNALVQEQQQQQQQQQPSPSLKDRKHALNEAQTNPRGEPRLKDRISLFQQQPQKQHQQQQQSPPKKGAGSDNGGGAGNSATKIEDRRARFDPSVSENKIRIAAPNGGGSSFIERKAGGGFMERRATFAGSGSAGSSAIIGEQQSPAKAKAKAAVPQGGGSDNGGGSSSGGSSSSVVTPPPSNKAPELDKKFATLGSGSGNLRGKAASFRVNSHQQRPSMNSIGRSPSSSAAGKEHQPASSSTPPPPSGGGRNFTIPKQRKLDPKWSGGELQRKFSQSKQPRNELQKRLAFQSMKISDAERREHGAPSPYSSQRSRHTVSAAAGGELRAKLARARGEQEEEEEKKKEEKPWLKKRQASSSRFVKEEAKTMTTTSSPSPSPGTSFRGTRKPEGAAAGRHTISGGVGELGARMAQFKEASSPAAFHNNRKKELASNQISGSSLGERVAQFKEASSPAAFRNNRKEELQNGSDAGSSSSAGGAAVAPDAAAADDEFNSFLALLGTPGPLPPPSSTSSINPQDGGGNPSSSRSSLSSSSSSEKKKKKAYFGRVVENAESRRGDDGGEDYDHLYDLALNLEQLKLQEHDSPHLRFGIGGFEDDDDDDDGGGGGVNGGGDIKSSLEGMIGNKTNYTANADWLNEEWIRQHLIEDDMYDSLKFRFRDPSLFRRFDGTSDEEKRDHVIRTFVKMLILHANDITQLDLAGCLLPDRFLEVLAEEVLGDPANSLPRLQLLNLESNVLQGTGIEALSDVISDDGAWRYLQAILLENQRHGMMAEAERALADAVGRSASVVVCSVSVRCQFKRKEINDAILRNMDMLRVARRDHRAREGTLRERKRNEMEALFDGIAANESPDVTEVELVGDQKFITLEDEEKIKSGAAFATNSSVRTIKMELLGLGDGFAEAFGEAIAQNDTIERVNIDSNAITGTGMRALFAGLGQNGSIEEFQVRHQKKVMATVDEDALPDLLANNTSIIKLGVDVRNQMVRMRLDRIVNGNRDRLRKLRANAKH